MKTTFFFALLAVCLTSAAQHSLDEKMYHAYLQRNPAEWITVVDQSKKEYNQSPTDATRKFKAAFAHFSLLSSTMVTKDEDLFDKYLDETKDLLKELIDKNQYAAEAKALLSATYGLQMGYSPMKGILLGGKSSKLADEAKTEAPLSPITWRVYGSSKYYTPASFGGDLNEAIAALEKSVKLFENKQEVLKHNWLYLDTLVLLAQAYSRNNENAKATSLYQKALSIEPGFFYAKSLLSNLKS